MAKTITLTEDTFINGTYRANGYSASVADDVAANLVAAGLATCAALDPVDTVRDLKLSDGTDKPMGAVTLVAGTKVVSNARVTANSRIFLTRQAAGGTVGHLGVSAQSAGSFTILASVNTDTSVVAYMIVEPS